MQVKYMVEADTIRGEKVVRDPGTLTVDSEDYKRGEFYQIDKVKHWSLVKLVDGNWSVRKNEKEEYILFLQLTERAAGEVEKMLNKLMGEGGN